MIVFTCACAGWQAAFDAQQVDEAVEAVSKHMRWCVVLAATTLTARGLVGEH